MTGKLFKRKWPIVGIVIGYLGTFVYFAVLVIRITPTSLGRVCVGIGLGIAAVCFFLVCLISLQRLKQEGRPLSLQEALQVLKRRKDR